MRQRNITWVSAAIIVISMLGCAGNNGEPSPGDNAKDRKIILTHWADNIIIPSYDSFQEKLEEMHHHGDAFIDAPSVANLALLRNAWQEAYTSWQGVELFEFGPADQYTLRNFFNIYPADVAGISANISNPDSNLDLPASYARQGFPALDYLINGAGATDEEIVAFYTTAPGAADHAAYLKRLLHRMEALLTGVISGWRGPYRDTFVSQTGLDIGSSFGLVVNAFVLNYERYIRTGKIGIPSGASAGSTGVTHPEKMEAFYKHDISLQLAATAHRAAVDFFNGIPVVPVDGAPSFKSYLDGLGAKDKVSGEMLSDLINAQFQDVDDRFAALSHDLGHELEVNLQEVVALHSSLQAAVRMLKVDMTSAMSVTITYTDNDGD